MNGYLSTLADNFVNSWEAFEWSNGGLNFTARLSNTDGFTGEHYDGEAHGLAIQGKTGEVLWFHISDSILCDRDHVDFWVLSPTCSRGRELGLSGVILNG